MHCTCSCVIPGCTVLAFIFSDPAITFIHIPGAYFKLPIQNAPDKHVPGPPTHTGQNGTQDQ